jgi:endonuclease-8
MPEGPEIRQAADTVAASIVNQPLNKVVFGLEHLKKWDALLSGSMVKSIETHGKAMLTRFANGLNIYSHNQLYGRWIISQDGTLPKTNRQLRLAIYTQTQAALLYSASEIEVLQDEEIAKHPFLSKLGPDVVSEILQQKQIIERLTAKRFNKRQIGGFLTDQSFVAGLGNYLRCEILFIAGLHPQKTPASLDNAQLEVLANAILTLPKQSYKTAGITNDLQQAEILMQQGSSFEDARFWVFRREGLACYKCQSEIKRHNMGGQSCYYCENCQQ